MEEKRSILSLLEKKKNNRTFLYRFVTGKKKSSRMSEYLSSGFLEFASVLVNK